MGSRSSTSQLPLLFALVVCLCLLPGAYAFGAGNIPSHSFLYVSTVTSFSLIEGKAFRHGDIEDILERLAKGGGFLGMSAKFSGLDIRFITHLLDGHGPTTHIHFYAGQAMDIAGLSKLPKQTILNLIMALGFLAHGYATGEFEVTDERLGVYLPTEHIDNPKGYAADQPGGDARKFDPRLRPPVNPQELEIDPRTGMKNYIANEQGTWDTSSRLVRERIHQCIDAGRRGDMYEAYRLLGCLMHTLEDFSAHSNWCELSLLRLGYKQVFCHVGDNCRIQSPAGPCPPLVTGTFGGADFIHSLLGEATDHISEASVSDLSKEMQKARSTQGGATDTLRDLLFQLPGDSGSNLSREMSDVEGIGNRAASSDPSTMSPQELHANLWKVLTFRDNVVKGIEVGISKVPGLSKLVDKLTESINRFVFVTLEPLLKPIMGQATQSLHQGSAAVVHNEDQFEVFNNPHASDPTHSFLSKDHFALILNEPAGRIAQIVVEHTVKLIVKAWEDQSKDVNRIATEILGCLHHPYFYDDSQSIQREMGAYLKSWIDGQSSEDKRYILNALTKESVKKHMNVRKGHKQDQVGHGAGGHYNSFLSPEKMQAAASQYIPGASGAFNAAHQASNMFNQASNYISRDGPDDVGGGGYQQPSGVPPPGPSSYQPGYNHPPPTQFGGSYDQNPGGFTNIGGYQQQPPPQPAVGFGGKYHHQQPQGDYYNPGGFQGGPPQHGGFEGGFQPPPPPPPDAGQYHPSSGGFHQQQSGGPPPGWQQQGGGYPQGGGGGYGGGYPGSYQ
ncbi:hypothetical protein OIO90_005570 [Microbotryomycetes sp. JL221]|nr:hypothetical protein OIO90_005570 [Microbotryomycetes sp. JL221]